MRADVLLFALFLSLVCASALAWASRALRRSWKKTDRLRAELERVQDEVWELREAASARDRAQAANEAKSRFLANVSHELRTPLHGILGMAEILSATGLLPEQQTYVAAIRSSASALASLIDEILDFSKIEAGKVAIAEESFDLVDLVEGVTELLAPRAQGKGLEIASMVAPDVPQQVIGDPVRLRQILLNLAGNAVKFTETGGIGLSVARVDATKLAFDIVDTGPGVPADRREAIFEDFERVDHPSVAFESGSGLGLAISKRLAEHMGGALTLEAAPDSGGAHFRLVLPLTSAQVAPHDMLDLAGRHILIVADSPFEAPFIAARLEARRAEAVLVGTGEAAIDAIATGSFDTILVDFALGEAESAAIRAAARAAGRVRTLVLFSPFERRALGQASAHGFDGWLVKPLRQRSLFGQTSQAPTTPLADRPALPSAAVASPGPRLGGRVLLAEDNPINTLLATRHLQRLGFDVAHAPDGLAALALAEAALDGGTPYDVVLLDLRMPGLDGVELARRIRLAEAARLVARPARLIAVSADVSARDRRFDLAGIDEYLPKPLSFARLAEALEPALKATA
jgi:signal transduction histidine kinase/CheY-like chemotaxis protein